MKAPATPAQVFATFTDDEKEMAGFIFPADKMPAFDDAQEARSFASALTVLAQEWQGQR